MKAALVKKEYLTPFVLITSLFFLWGFARSILDVLNKHFQDAFEMTKASSALVQVSVYLAYFLMAIPAGLYINRYGYRRGVVFGLLLFAVGAFLFIPSDLAMSFAFFLVSLFVLGCGLVFLETAANPYAATLGDPRTAASRLNLAQSFNGLGCIFGPFIMGSILFAESSDSAPSIAVPYTVLGVFILLVALVFTRVKLPEIQQETKAEEKAPISGLWKHKGFTLGIIALLSYEIAEIAINSFFVNYVCEDGWMEPLQASALLSFGALALFMVARVIGSLVMSRIAAERVLCFCAVMTVIGTILVIANIGLASKIGLFACYAFEAIMFPTIFAISLKGLGAYTKRASSYLMMTPIGGAIGTYVMGYVADISTMAWAFTVPCAGYIIVLHYSLTVVQKRS
ncbi:MAG: sugar MFS transporter [Bacteroidales bacterium]|nr:sugar MFS transporter [Bacteroidales bacterium]